MILKSARVALGARQAALLDIRIDQGRLYLLEQPENTPALDLSGYLVLPGLINVHDHLEFNLFPRLGSGPYPNAAVWAKDIHHPEQPPVRDHLRIPKRLRLLWGGIKNLFSGVTSVLHHNPYHSVFDADFPVRVIRRYGWSHSLGFSTGLAGDFARTPPGAPFLIHGCEGTDSASAGEFDRLDAAGVLRPGTIIVHGVALREPDLDRLQRRGVALAWCPTSNQFTLGQTLPRYAFDCGIPIALGTDSALTAAGDLTDEIQAALEFVDCERIYRMVTGTAAHMLRLDAGEGTIRHGGIANLIAMPDRGARPAEALIGMRPELVILQGRIKLISPALAEQLPRRVCESFQPLAIEGRGRRLVDCDVAALLDAGRQVLGDDLRLAGKAVAA